MGLAQLVLPLNAIGPAILHEVGAGLVKPEGHPPLHALPPEVEHPIVVARTRIHARLAPDRDLLDRRIKIRQEVYPLEQGSRRDDLMLDGGGEENGQTIIRHRLVLDRASNQHIVVAIAPIIRDTLRETVDALGEEIEHAVTPLAHHAPAVRPPFVGIFQEEIRGETSEDHLARRQLVRLVTLALDREVERGRFPGDIASYLAPVHLVLPIDVAELTARTELRAPVPRVPVGICAPRFRHTPSPSR